MALGLSSLNNPVVAQSFTICPEANSKQGIQVFQGLDGWLFHRGDFIDDAAINADSIKQLERLKAAFDYRDMQAVLAIVPPRAAFHSDKFDLNQEIFTTYNNALAQAAYWDAVTILNGVGILTPDLLSFIKQQEHPEWFSFERDSHWSPYGASKAALSLAEAIQALPEYALIEQIDYEVVATDIAERKTDLSGYARSACPNLVIPPEPEQKYELIGAQTTDLFSDTTSEQIVLWGSSYSSNASFQEFLQDYLNTDVINYAVKGGGVWSAMLEYFLAPKDAYPPIAVWEIPYRNVRNHLNSAADYREIIPTIYGDCSAEQTVFEGSEVSVRTDKASLLPSATFANWQTHRLDLFNEQVDLSGTQDAAKLVFTGEKDPSVLFKVETGQALAGQSFTQSVWLWTDANQPKNAALYFYALPQVRDIASQRITLTNTPTKYSFSHTFSDQEQTSFMIRVDGIEGDNDEVSATKAGTYLYASSPELYQTNALSLIKNEQANVSGNTYYSYLELSDLSMTSFELIADYADGQKDISVINRSDRISNNGAFFWELSSAIDAPLKQLSLNLPANATGTVKAKLCHTP